MQKQNVSEYKIIRSEVENIKNCVTDYVKFLFLAVSAVISGILALETDLTYLPLSYSSIVISFIVCFLFDVLLYKFISHNCYAGYSLLLSQEIWEDEGLLDKEDDMILWEPCLSRLRKLNIDKTDPDHQEYKDYIAKLKEKESNFWSGFCFLSKAIFTSQKTFSWEFPISILRIFLIVFCLFFFFGFFSIVKSIFVCVITRNDIFAFFILFITLGLSIYFWSHTARIYHSIMLGNRTILGFRDRFYFIREKILKHYGIKTK